MKKKDQMNMLKPSEQLKFLYDWDSDPIVIPTPFDSNPAITLTVCYMQEHGLSAVKNFYHVGAYSPSYKVRADPKYTIVVVTAAVRASEKKLCSSIMKPKMLYPYRNMLSHSTRGPVYMKQPK